MEDFIEEYVNSNGIVGLACGIVRDGKLAWKKGYGFANIKDQIEVKPDTIFLLASVSKTITAVAAMILYERGSLDLDMNINEYLPFTVTNPNHPDVPITARMLLTHTSSIMDDKYNELDDSVLYIRDEEEMEYDLGSLLKAYLDTEGDFYDPELCFSKSEPNTEFSYSNVGSALLGYLVEVISEQHFDEFCDENIFEVLGMENTSWNLTDFDLQKVALPYYNSKKTRGHYESPDYPNGMLRSTIEDMAKFLIMFIKNGEYKGRRVLKENTVKLMKKTHFKYEEDGEENRIGFTWYFLDYSDEEIYLGHTGAEEGVTTSMFYEINSEVGVLVFVNQSEVDTSEIEDYLFQNAEINI